MNILKITLAGIAAAILVFLCVDCLAGRVRHFECNVVDHRYVPPSTQFHTSTDEHGHTHTWVTTIPEDYQLLCDELAGARTFNVSVGRYTWDTMTNGQYVTVRTREGRWTKFQWLPAISK